MVTALVLLCALAGSGTEGEPASRWRLGIELGSLGFLIDRADDYWGEIVYASYETSPSVGIACEYSVSPSLAIRGSASTASVNTDWRPPAGYPTNTCFRARVIAARLGVRLRHQMCVIGGGLGVYRYENLWRHGDWSGVEWLHLDETHVGPYIAWALCLSLDRFEFDVGLRMEVPRMADVWAFLLVESMVEI